VVTSSQSHFPSHTQLQAYGWRAFCIEFLCGIVAITWYLLFLAEKTTLRGLTRLERFASPPPEDLSGYGRVSNVLLQDEGF
jgi:hypothetical protein